MNDFAITTVQAVSIAGSTFVFGFVFGWIWALHFFVDSSHSSKPLDKEK